MLKIIISLVFFSSFSFPANAEKLKLLVLPLSDGTSYILSTELKKKCSLEGVDEIVTTKLKLGHRGNWFIENVNLLQNEINLEINSKTLTSEHILLTLNIAANFEFEFQLDKSTCKLKKTLYFNGQKYPLDEIYIEYSTIFFSPVIKRIIVVNEGESNDLHLYPWALHGAIPTYEFNLGPAVNIHSNIRLKNQNAFEKNNLVIEPIPAFFFRYGPLFLSKDGLGSLLYHQGDWTLLGMGILEGEPYKTDGLNERKKGFYIGTLLKYKLLEVFFYKDFFDGKGYNLKMNIAPELYVNTDWKFTPQLFVQFWDKNYVDYYFGVKPEETASGMRAYKGHQTINFGTVLEASHYVGDWTFVTGIGVKKFGGNVYSSPTIIRQNEWKLILGVLYKIF